MPAIPDTMTAIEITEPGGPDVLKPATRPVPRPGLGQILIKVAAAGVNRPDVLQRQGLYPVPKDASDLPGLEVAGEVVALGPGVSDWADGDRVTALVHGGGYAEYCLAEAAVALPVPAGLGMDEAAALPETVFTVWTNLFDRAGLQSGERVLIHGGTSGIGTTAIQMAAAQGARVFATAGSPRKVTVCQELGAERGIDYKVEDFVSMVKELTSGEGVDVVLDMVGGDYIPRNLEILRDRGRHVSIAFLQGAKVDLNFLPVLLKRLTLTGSTLRPRTVEEKAQIAQAVRGWVWPKIESGLIRPVMDYKYPLAEAADAHRRIDAGEHIGKIVLTVG